MDSKENNSSSKDGGAKPSSRRSKNKIQGDAKTTDVAPSSVHELEDSLRKLEGFPRPFRGPDSPPPPLPRSQLIGSQGRGGIDCRNIAVGCITPGVMVSPHTRLCFYCSLTLERATTDVEPFQYKHNAALRGQGSPRTVSGHPERLLVRNPDRRASSDGKSPGLEQGSISLDRAGSYWSGEEKTGLWHASRRENEMVDHSGDPDSTLHLGWSFDTGRKSMRRGSTSLDHRAHQDSNIRRRECFDSGRNSVHQRKSHPPGGGDKKIAQRRGEIVGLDHGGDADSKFQRGRIYDSGRHTHRRTSHYGGGSLHRGESLGRGTFGGDSGYQPLPGTSQRRSSSSQTAVRGRRSSSNNQYSGTKMERAGDSRVPSSARMVPRKEGDIGWRI